MKNNNLTHFSTWIHFIFLVVFKIQISYGNENKNLSTDVNQATAPVLIEESKKNEVGKKPSEVNLNTQPINNTTLAPEVLPTAIESKFNYDPKEGRDPFKIYREFTPESAIRTNDNQVVKKEISISTALIPSDVTLVGIMFRLNNSTAAIKVKGGKTYFLKVKDKIGRYEGKIISITDKEVVIEQIKEFDGEKKVETVTLKMGKYQNL